jgi:digeranylgeranylglycerophospholipid reductase
MDNGSEEFDVCIIGGSLAGNYLCYLLSTSGLKIAVIEEHTDIGKPLQCAGIVSKKIKKLIDLTEDIIIHKVKVAKLISPSGKSILLSGDEEPLIIDRVGLDKHFYNLVAHLPHIHYFLGEKFRTFSYITRTEQIKLSITTSKRTIEAKMLIGCDGPLSSVARSFNSINKVIFASQILIKGKFDKDQAIMYFDSRWKELFGWIVPEGKDFYRVGLATSKNIFSKFKSFLNMLNLDFEDKVSQQGGIIPYGLMKKVAFKHVLLLGDSACQVKATTGGGIIMLLTAAEVAAKAIRISFNLNNFSDKILKLNYEKPCKKLIGIELKIHYVIRRILEKFGPNDYDTVFTILKTQHIEHQISLYGDMDFPKRLIYKLLRNGSVLKFLLKFFIRHPKLLGIILLVFLKN